MIIVIASWMASDVDAPDDMLTICVAMKPLTSQYCCYNVMIIEKLLLLGCISIPVGNSYSISLE